MVGQFSRPMAVTVSVELAGASRVACVDGCVTGGADRGVVLVVRPASDGPVVVLARRAWAAAAALRLLSARLRCGRLEDGPHAFVV